VGFVIRWRRRAGALTWCRNSSLRDKGSSFYRCLRSCTWTGRVNGYCKRIRSYRIWVGCRSYWLRCGWHGIHTQAKAKLRIRQARQIFHLKILYCKQPWSWDSLSASWLTHNPF
jgi:hypothetical protein